jgi:transcriptional regulator GlxA family with amidase domain
MADSLVERVRLYVQLNYTRPDLDAALLAYEHHISTRYLFKVWSSQPSTLIETIMSTRLEAARRILATQPLISVAAVAHRCGFRNVSHFSRRYRAAFGQTPTETQLGLSPGGSITAGRRIAIPDNAL